MSYVDAVILGTSHRCNAFVMPFMVPVSSSGCLSSCLGVPEGEEVRE